MYDLIVVGGSTGSLEALRELLPVLSERLRAAVVIVLHQYRDRSTALASVIAEWTSRSTLAIDDGTPLVAGRIYVAPADYHTLVERETAILALSKDAPVVHARPSIDVLFESAAAARGRSLIGVLLSGGGTDGVAGLRAVKARGGLAIVQDPTSATEPHAILRAQEARVVDWVGAPSDIGQRLEELCS